jgi:ribonuclease HI
MEGTHERPTVTITTDGAARGNPGPGGWAALLQHGNGERLLMGEGPEKTTNNAMELYAVVAALEALKRPCRVVLRADSTYMIEGLQRLLEGGSTPAKNRELWERLLAAARPHEIVFEWVRGHSGDPRNERVDRAANAAANRAFLAVEESRGSARSAEEWTLALCSPSARRPVRWALITPAGRSGGEVPGAGVTGPTAVYQALIAGLAAAQRLAGGTPVGIKVVSNYELIVKQGRGEWRVKNPAQRELAAHVAALRRDLGEVRFEFAPTEEVLALLDRGKGPATGD